MLLYVIIQCFRVSCKWKASGTKWIQCSNLNSTCFKV